MSQAPQRPWPQTGWRLPVVRLRLLYKYILLMLCVTSTVLVLNGVINIWMSYEEQKRSLVRLHREQAAAGALQIAQYVRELETQLSWLVQSPWALATDEDRHVDAIRLMTLVPAVHELVLLDPQGREELSLSRLGSDAIKSRKDWGKSGEFTTARSGKIHYGPVYFQRNSEPYIRIGLAGHRRDSGIVVADINLKLIWEVVTKIQIGGQGRAYVVDATGRLVAHPDISLVLRKTDMSALSHIRTARLDDKDDDGSGSLSRDLDGQQVLTTHARIPRLGWLMVVERPASEAFAPVYASLSVTAGVLSAGVVLAILASILLARAMIQPIRELQSGAARFGSGALDHRISIKSGDELEELGNQFNDMASRLETSYATLEQKVDERTEQLALANKAKSRFLAAASHDLRQPLNALNLFVGQLRTRSIRDEERRLVTRIDAALSSMNEQFDALLDISKLDAGVIVPSMTEFPINSVLSRIETTFQASAEVKGLRLRIVSSRASANSDALLLERILSNLVSNAIRYTRNGGVVIGCRHKGRSHIRIDVCDTGAGIPEAHLKHIFAEFYRVSGPSKLGESGFGLGLSIVERLTNLLRHTIEVSSREGRGSRFSIVVPVAAAGVVTTTSTSVRPAPSAFGAGKSVLVVDDDPLALDAMIGLLEDWGFEVLDAGAFAAALRAAHGAHRPPDVIVSDLHLGEGETGLDLIARLRAELGRPIPAVLVTADGSQEIASAASASRIHLLPKPVLPLSLRALLAGLTACEAAPQVRQRMFEAEVS